MENFDSRKLNKEQIQKINNFIEEKHEEIKTICANNELIREDIFPLLDKYCTVIYFPTEDKENNGFHKNYILNQKLEHFVYINTAQHKEKQIFTAAHELGHIWEITKYLDENTNVELEERIVNRFASELLMPLKSFDTFVKKELHIYLTVDKISVIDMLKVITATMNHFFTSYKSVVYRFYEIGMLRETDCRLLWGETPDYPREKLIEFSQKIAKENGYIRLYQENDNHKWINGLKELLDKASKSNNFSKEWLQSFYDKFDFNQNLDEVNLHDTLPIFNLEEDVIDDK